MQPPAVQAVGHVGNSYFLAQGTDLVDLKRRIEAAAQTTGTFFDFVVVGNRATSVLISTGTPIVFSVETVQYDDRDTGDDDELFGGLFDY
ncbi:MAG: hypothetical protein ACXWXI_11330 [Aeromicrobium sp.]